MMNQNHAIGNSNVHTNAAGLFTFLNASINSTFTKPWILDNRSTNHIISNPIVFTQIKPSSIPIVILPTGSSASITSKGTISFNPDITLDKFFVSPPFT